MVLIEHLDAPEAWDSLVEQLDGNLHHTSLNARLLHRVNGVAPVYLTLLDDDRALAGLTVAFWQERSNRLAAALTRSAMLDTAPLLKQASAARMRETLLEVEAYARHNGAVWLRINPFQSACTADTFGPLGYATKAYCEFVVDTSQPEERLWKNLSQHHRRALRKAEKHSLEVAVGRDRGDLAILGSLTSISKRKAQKRGESYSGFSERHSDAYKSILLDNDAADVHIVYHEGRPVSAALIPAFNRRASFLFGGSNHEGYALSASIYLLWRAILWAKQHGCREFNLGGVRPDMRLKDSPFYGLYRLKRGFGGVEVDRLAGKKLLRPYRARIHYGLRRMTRRARRAGQAAATARPPPDGRSPATSTA